MLKDQNNPAVLGSIAEVLKKSQEIVNIEQAKEAEAAAVRYEGWKVETEWKKSKPRSEKQSADVAHNLAGKGLKSEKEKELAAMAGDKNKITKKDVLVARGVYKEEVEQIDEKEYSMPYNSSKTTSAGDRYKHVIAHAKKMGYKVHHQDTAGDEKGDADITVRYQGGESRHSSDPESIEIHKGGKADKDKTAHAIAGGKATSMKNEEWEAIEEALDPKIAAAFQKVAKGVEVHMKHKESGKINVAKFPGGMNAVKAAKEHEAEMAKQGYEVHKRKIMEEKTLSAILDEARGRPRKNPAPVAKKNDDEDGDDYGPDKGPEADQNIQNHLKKAIDSNGEHHVKFADGSAHKVPAHVAHKVLTSLHKLKPEARAQAQDHIYQSHKNLMQVHKMLG